jgi:apolipoprotein N-acyltransferase
MFSVFVVTIILSKISGKFNFPLFIIIWLSTEYIISRWDLAWPWFSLGNIFAESTSLIQWYSYTGTAGGTLWILLCNWLIYNLLKSIQKGKQKEIFINCIQISFVIAIPILISYNIGKNLPDQKTDFLLGVIQPNINPRTEKFNGISEHEQISRGLYLIDSVDINELQLLIFPETFLTNTIDEDSLDFSSSLKRLSQATGEIPLITGAFTSKVNNHTHIKTLYNSMIYMNHDQKYVYHKTRLLPLVEKQPFLWLLNPFRKYIEKSGAYFGSYGSDNVSVGFLLQDGTRLAPIICLESVFGEYTSKIVTESNASFIVLITNDGWWSSDAGYRQHLAYARLRSIETRRWMVRCANTGVSAVIDPEGNIAHHTEYGKAEFLKASVGRHIGPESFYVRFGDYIGKAAIILLAGWLVLNSRKIVKMNKL